MAKTPLSWTEKGLLDELQKIDAGHHGHKICFILGAGASVSSGVPTGGQLVDEWLHTEHNRETDGKESFEQWAVRWAAEGEQPIQNFDPKFAARFYPQIYERIFACRYSQAYEFLDEKMKDSRPGIGYVLLAQILEFTRHKIVVTTNFDNLVTEALYFYSGARPLICGHESLAIFASANTVRPLVAKIHRDLFLNPINDAEGTSQLAENWKKSLTEIFRAHTPVVIGYGGNDGSLMGFLNSLDPGAIHNGIYWCYRRGEPVRDEINEVVAKHHGKLVAIDGFDPFMLKLHVRFAARLRPREKRKIESFIRERADEQIKRYKSDMDKFGSKTVAATSKLEFTPDETITALKKITPLAEKPESWWVWELRAHAENDPHKRDAIYREGIKKFPQSAELINEYALFLKNVRKSYDEAEKFYRRALELEPKNSIYISNYALFLRHIRKNNDESEKLYRRALDLDPKSDTSTNGYARLLEKVRKDYDGAEKMYQRTLELVTNDSGYVGNYAHFLETIRKNYGEAEKLYKRALDLDANDAVNIGYYAHFLETTQKNYDEAEKLYKHSLDLAARNSPVILTRFHENMPTIIGNYALFLQNVTQNYDEAEKMFRRSTELDSENPKTLRSYGEFLRDVRKNAVDAEKLFKRAENLEKKTEEK